MEYVRRYVIHTAELIRDWHGRVVSKTEAVDATTLAKLEALGFEGIDVSLESSLMDYGMAWVEKDGDWHFVYAIGHGRYDRASYPVDTDWRTEFDWAAEAGPVCGLLSSLGMSLEEFEELTFPRKVAELYGYGGYENVFGTAYGGGFMVFKDGRNRKAEYLETIEARKDGR